VTLSLEADERRARRCAWRDEESASIATELSQTVSAGGIGEAARNVTVKKGAVSAL